MTQHRTPRVFFYVQHLLGIGHLARASRIAAALVDNGFDVTMVTGGTAVPGFPGANIHHVALPPVTAGDAGFSGLADAAGNPVDKAFEERRRDMLLAACHETKPDVVVIEAFPFGRRQVRFELIPLLEAIHGMAQRPRVVTSLRDILQERTKPGRDEESVALVWQYFDHVLVHGDPSFARLEDTFRLAEQITDKIIYTGLVAAPPPAPPSEIFDVLVSAGGGAVGNDLLRASLQAARTLPETGRWCVITGPNLLQADFDTISAAAPDHVRVVRFRQDFASLLAGARLSISQAGYNTVCDVLRAGCHALLVPFTAGGETEQTVRAERLERLGLATVLTEEALSASSMTQMVTQALNDRHSRHHRLDLNGAQRTADILRAMVN